MSNTAVVSGGGDGNVANNTAVNATTIDPKPAVTLAVTDGNASETGSDGATLLVTRTGSTSAGLTVAYTLSGTATNGGDYQTLSGSVVIPAGATSATIMVTPIDDTAVEGNETVVVTLTTGSSYNLGTPSSGTATILDNDSTTIISSVTVPYVDSKSSSVAWLTNVPADSQVEYGTTTAYGSLTTLITTLTTNHTVKLTGLRSSTLYHFRVKSKSSSGGAATSGDYTFKTLIGAPGKPRIK